MKDDNRSAKEWPKSIVQPLLASGALVQKIPLLWPP
jgi:hypothetical protein